jgi:hypothetical protein
MKSSNVERPSIAIALIALRTMAASKEAQFQSLVSIPLGPDEYADPNNIDGESVDGVTKAGCLSKVSLICMLVWERVSVSAASCGGRGEGDVQKPKQ